MKCEEWDCSENAELIIIEMFNSKAHGLCPMHAYQFKRWKASTMLLLSEEYSIERLKKILKDLFKAIK